jgi:hypothetical protein
MNRRGILRTGCCDPSAAIDCASSSGSNRLTSSARWWGAAVVRSVNREVDLAAHESGHLQKVRHDRRVTAGDPMRQASIRNRRFAGVASLSRRQDSL